LRSAAQSAFTRARVREQRRPARPDEARLLECDRLVAQGAPVVEQVRREHSTVDAAAPLLVEHPVEQARSRRVELPVGLVQQEHARVLQQRPREASRLRIAGGEDEDRLVRPGEEAHFGEQGVDAVRGSAQEPPARSPGSRAR
jgi:hypothetical protein